MYFEVPSEVFFIPGMLLIGEVLGEVGGDGVGDSLFIDPDGLY